MRIIHTGDWHIGQTLGGYARDHEHRAVLDQLVHIASERQPDALILAGDVFDSQNASGDAQALYYDTLVRLNRACPAMTIVVTAGNHDAAGRLEAPRALLGAIRVHVVGNIRRRDGRIDAGYHLVPIRTAKGEIAANVLAVSYPTAACLPPLARYDGDVARATGDLYGELMDAVRPSLRGLPLIVTGHLHVAGGLESEGAERRILVGGQHALAPSALPEEADYIALGHLHKAQMVGRETTRYCGSLIPLSSAEQSYTHGVTQVTLGTGTPAIERIPLLRPVPFLRLPTTGDVHLSDLGDHLKALDLDPSLPIEWQPFLHLQLARSKEVVTGYRTEVDRIAENFAVRLVDVRLTPLPTRVADAATADPLARLADLAPEDLFRRAYERVHGAAPERAHLDVFHHLLAEA